MRVRFVLGLLSLLLAGPALAQDKPDAKDSAVIQDCIKTKTGAKWNWENCIGVISEPCSKDETSMAPSQVIACHERERAVWDGILNQSYQRLLKALDDNQTSKLRDMQRAWIASRDKTCGFIYDYFEGSMAYPMIAAA
jgi:hypothetical protein